MPIESIQRWREANFGEQAGPRNPMQRWLDHDTRKTAIEAMCWQCMGGTVSSAEGARASIRACSAGPGSIVPCPLHAWRPYR